MSYISRMITFVMLFCVVSIPVSAQSQQTILNVVVPTHCSLQVNISGRGTVFVDGEKIAKSESVSIQRQKGIIIDFQPGMGYQLATVLLNETDITKELHSGKLLLGGISSDSVLTVFFMKNNAVWPGSNPPTGDGIMGSAICCNMSMMALLFLLNRKRKQ